MRIVQIGAYPLSPDLVRGGVEASVYGLAKELGKSNVVHVFDAPRKGGGAGTVEEENIHVHRTDNPGKWQVSAIRQIKKMVEKIVKLQPDVCHIHGTNLFAWMMYRRLKKEGLPCIVTVHGLARVEKKNALKKSFSIKGLSQYLYQGWVEKRFLGQLPLVVVDTEYVKDIVEHYPIRRKPAIYVIPQGIDESFFYLGCSCSSNIILSVGAINERKGHLLTFKAFETIKKKGVDARLVIAGVSSDKNYFESLQTIVASSSYKNDVLLLPDLPTDKLKQWYEKAHLFVLHTQEESQGIVFSEAMAVGLPVVSTCVGGVPFVIEHGSTGLLSNYSDVETYADNIALLMTDDELWLRMSKSCREVSQNYHWRSISNNIVKLYMTLKGRLFFEVDNKDTLSV